jgi:hypothetical protein
LITLKNKSLIVISDSVRFANNFIDGLNGRDLFLSYGKEVVDGSQYETTSFWMAGGFAARMQRAGLAMNLCAPGQSWLSGLDSSLTGRRIVTGTLSDMPDDDILYAKPAEAKVRGLISAKYTKQQIRDIYATENVPSETILQWSADILDINHEHRFFVANGEIMAGSPYLVDSIVYTDGMTSPFSEVAKSFALDAIKELGDNQPPAYTLDVGRNEQTGEWLIIEANPAWSSGLYGCNSAAVIDALDIACHTMDEKWLWKPSQYLVDNAAKAELIQVVAYDRSTGVMKFSA